MVVSQLRRVELKSTVLTSKVISDEEIVARELHLRVFTSYLHVMKETYDRRYMNRQGDTSNLTIIHFHYFDLVLEKHFDGPFPGDDLKRFIRSVEEQSLIHSSDRFFGTIPMQKSINATNCKRLSPGSVRKSLDRWLLI